MFAYGLTQAQLLSQVQQSLIALRNAINVVGNFESWASGISAADLTPLGFSTADANTLLSAIADAAAVAQLYKTGLPPSTYPQPASAYVYAASQTRVIGPQ